MRRTVLAFGVLVSAASAVLAGGSGSGSRTPESPSGSAPPPPARQAPDTPGTAPVAPAGQAPDAASLGTPTGADYAGRYRLVGRKGDLHTRGRLVVAPRADGTFSVARESECLNNGRTTVLRGDGELRRGLLLVEFRTRSQAPASTASATPDAEGASPKVRDRAAGMGATLERRLDGLEAREAAGQSPKATTAPAVEQLPPVAGPIVIQGSVGQDGVNDPADILIIEQALQRRGYLESTGVPMSTLIAAIRRYQRERAGFRWPDGRVDVDNRTIRALNGEERPATPGQLPDPTDTPLGAPLLDDPDGTGADTPLEGVPPLGPVESLPDPATLFPGLHPDAAVAVYLIKDGYLQGAARDTACGGDPSEWTVERGVRAGDAPAEAAEVIDAASQPATSDVRERIARIANSHAGIGWNIQGTRERYMQLLFPHDTEYNQRAFAESMWSCGLFGMAVLRELGKRHRSLEIPYASQIGTAVHNVVTIAQQDDAWVNCENVCPLPPQKGDMVLIGRGANPAWGGVEHILVVVEVRGNTIISVDGGQPHVGRRERTWSTRANGDTWLGTRRVAGYLSAERLKLD